MHDTAPLIVSIDHPSVEQDVWDFAAAVRNEQRFFGPSAAPKPYPSLVNRVISAGAPRIAAIIDGRLVGLCRVEPNGIAFLVVLASCRRQGIGRRLLAAAVERSASAGMPTLVLQSSRRSRAVAALGREFSATTVDRGCGRVDVLIPTGPNAQSA